MTKIIASPTRYIQGSGELANLAVHATALGKKAFIIISESGIKRSGDLVRQSYEGADGTFEFETFGGECSRPEIERLQKSYEKKGCDLVIGIGGGKILDTAKAVAFYMNAPVVICPTIAATDAPCSALSVIYTPEGMFEEYLFLPQNPNVVIVDTDIILKAPARLLVAGMGDALATVFEARSAMAKGAANVLGGQSTLAAMALAELCYETLITQGLKAKLALEAGGSSPAVDKIIEANTYLSGIGFESGGLAGAHAVHNGMTAYEETHDLYHGEKVAFGTLVQLVLEDYDDEDLDELITFCLSVGLPVTLKDLGIAEPDQEKLMKVAELACADTDTMGNLTVPVTPRDVYGAILAADALGRYSREQ